MMLHVNRTEINNMRLISIRMRTATSSKSCICWWFALKQKSNSNTAFDLTVYSECLLKTVTWSKHILHSEITGAAVLGSIRDKILEILIRIMGTFTLSTIWYNLWTVISKGKKCIVVFKASWKLKIREVVFVKNLCGYQNVLTYFCLMN